MKNLFYFLCTGLFFLTVTQLNGQGNNPHFLRTLAHSDGQSIKLRWVASDFDTWQEGNTSGYSLERYTTHQNGVLLDGVAFNNSKVTLSTNIVPLSESQWDTQFSGNNFAQLAKGTLYEADTTIEISASPTLADALNNADSKESRFLFALFAAEQDFEVATGMALAYEDTGITAGDTYLYILKINATNPPFADIQTAVSIEASNIVTLPVITGLEGEAMDKAVAIQWNLMGVDSFYSSYDIERSTDGSNFQPVNDLPFIFGSDAEESPEFAIYLDSLEDNSTIYHYRLRGRTPFSQQGPPSASISLQGIPARIGIFLKIDDYAEASGEMSVSWDSFDSALENDIQGFNIYRSTKSNEDFEQLNTALLPATARAFTDTDPLQAAYYKLEALDNNGHYYSSPAALVQQSDSIPPAIPTALTAEFVTSTTLQLEWQENTEEDLKGYRVFMANGRHTNFVQVTKYPLTEAKYIHEVDPAFNVDSIFFKVLSCDLRENNSDLSEVFVLDRPDVLPPAKPLLFKASPTPEGIEVGFRFSSSEDVANHVLQRKAAGTPGWIDILEITKAEQGDYENDLTPGSITSTSYLDTTILKRREFQYRFLAYDNDDNASSSEVITVRPYDSGERGEISAIKAQTVRIPSPNIYNDPVYLLLEDLIAGYNANGVFSDALLGNLVNLNVITSEELEALMELTPYEIFVYLNQLLVELFGEYINAEVHLAWDYSSEDQLVDFQIYRSAEGSAMMLYKTLKVVDLVDYTYKDEDVKQGRRYFYQVMARHLGNGFSKRSEALMVKVPKY